MTLDLFDNSRKLIENNGRSQTVAMLLHCVRNACALCAHCVHIAVKPHPMPPLQG